VEDVVDVVVLVLRDIMIAMATTTMRRMTTIPTRA